MRSNAFLLMIFVGMTSLCMFFSGVPVAEKLHTNVALAASSSGQTGEKPSYPVLKAGEKIKMDDEHYFVYGFDKKPQMGTVILKIQVFGKDGSRDTSYEIIGNAGMPSMKGMHDSGEQPFKLSKKGDYLLPVEIVMPGDWEVVLQIFKDKKAVFSGRVIFDV